ncbi:hypothetical protein MPNT_280027 [Candidatus Methylacidithermus pantelleriae]|uniref:Uncharacterized protein n=1 Tax=Candidatus Methylacidithermus pantelleriae TaxID=2744239 RepID=A0A8J2BTS0_9BACT|nr:hypothetical protein MPNT_280027 [Candidatus Methylacidithermus pantelleriae]
MSQSWGLEEVLAGAEKGAEAAVRESDLFWGRMCFSLFRGVRCRRKQAAPF